MSKKKETNALTRIKPTVLPSLMMSMVYGNKVMCPPKENHFTHAKGEDSVPDCLEALGKVVSPENKELYEVTLVEETHDWCNDEE